MSLKERHQGRQTIKHLALLWCLQQVNQAALVGARTLTQPRHDAGQGTSRIGVDQAKIGVHLIDEVTRKPGYGAKLHTMRLLMQAHPESEVSGRHIQLPLRMHDIGRHEEQPAFRSEGFVLSEHLAG